MTPARDHEEPRVFAQRGQTARLLGCSGVIRFERLRDDQRIGKTMIEQQLAAGSGMCLQVGIDCIGDCGHGRARDHRSDSLDFSRCRRRHGLARAVGGGRVQTGREHLTISLRGQHTPRRTIGRTAQPNITKEFGAELECGIDDVVAGIAHPSIERA